MVIRFKPLARADFSLLLKWLETEHVKAWWDPEVSWTPERVAKKYNDYVQGFKRIQGVKKPIKAYIVYKNTRPIGYLQLFNVYDFLKQTPYENLPQPLNGIDFFIGEVGALGQHLGEEILRGFFEIYSGTKAVPLFVDPHRSNSAAIKTFERVGFHRHIVQPESDKIWMIKKGASE